jgi:hypothetical protein
MGSATWRKRLVKKKALGSGRSPVKVRLSGSERIGSGSRSRAPSTASTCPWTSHTITYPVHPQPGRPDQRHAGDPRQHPRPPAAALREHPQRVHHDRHQRRVGREAVQPADPPPQPHLLRDALRTTRTASRRGRRAAGTARWRSAPPAASPPARRCGRTGSSANRTAGSAPRRRARAPRATFRRPGGADLPCGSVTSGGPGRDSAARRGAVASFSGFRVAA